MKQNFFNWKGPAIGAALLAAAAALLLAACPAAGGGGAGEDPFSYLCTNGTAVDGTTDASTDAGRVRCAQCDRFYKLNGTAGELGTSCEQIAIGEATRIGNVSQFGVSEDFPFDLAALGDILYMVGSNNDWLYTIDITDGSATQVGSLAAGFGVGEGVPTGLAAIGDILYMVGAGTDRLYTLNIVPGDGTPDGSAIQVGSLAAGFRVGETAPRGLAALGSTLYMAGVQNERLYSLNITSGDGTPDGSAIQVGVLTRFGVGETTPTGLAALGTTLYMVGQFTDYLSTLNITDGRATQVGSLVGGFGVRESNPTGLAALGTTLYMVGQDNLALYALRYQ